jgi:hypothetical protein
MQAQTDLDDLDMVIRRRNGRYLAKIPQVGLYAAADSLPNALAALEVKKQSLLEELTAADALGEIHAVSDTPTGRMQVLPALGVFAAKGAIVVVLILAAVGYTRHAIEAEINQIRSPKVGGTVFWANVESNLARAADPANDLPAAKKEALLAELRVIVDRWRPFVREVGRLFSDHDEAQAGKP